MTETHSHLHDWFGDWSFLVPAVATAAALAVGGGAAGPVVLSRRESLMALAVPHAVTVGVAVGMRWGFPTLPCGVLAAAAVLALLTLVRRRGGDQLLLPGLLVAGVCFAILVVAGSGEHLAEVEHRFVGIDVAVDDATAVGAGITLTLTGLAVGLLWRRWLSIAQLPDAAALAGVRPWRWHAAFWAMLSAILIVGTDAVGPTMVLALLFLPAGTIMPWVRRLPSAMVGAVLLGWAFLAAGVALSVHMEWPLSHSVGAVGFAAAAVSNLAASARP